MSRPALTVRKELKLYEQIVSRFWTHELSDFLYDRKVMPLRLNAQDLQARWRDYLAEGSSHVVDCYVHIPFCRHICHFCSLFPEQLSQPAQLESYAALLAAETAFFAPAFAGRSLRNLYFGGGTPSLLEPRHLETVLAGLSRGFSFSADAERCFEMHPASITPEKIGILKTHGFNRASLGVQSFDDGVLAKANRSDQSARDVARAAEMVMKDIPSLNLDLILGLEGDTPESFMRSFQQTVALGPQEICVYVNKAQGTQIKLFHEGQRSRFLEKNDLLRLPLDSIKKGMAEIAERHGYELQPTGVWAYEFQFVSKSWAPRRNQRGYSSNPQGGVACLSLGARAASRIPGRLVYTADPTRRVFAPEKPAYSGVPIAREEEELRYVMNQVLQTSGFARSEFKSLFEAPFEERFGRADRRLRSLGAIKRRGGELKFPGSHRTRLARAFFFAGPSLVREWLDRRHSAKNEIVVTLKGFRFSVWIERAVPEREYAFRRGGYGLQCGSGGANKAPAALEGIVRRLVEALFLKLAGEESELSGPELTYLLHRKIGGVLRRSRRIAADISLNPWSASRQNTGLGL